jgi:glycerol-1-phosphate dehydrogenase [NAD(P)+]
LSLNHIDQNVIADLLAHASTTRTVVARRNAKDDIAEIAQDTLAGRRVTIVADEITWAIAGGSIDAALRAASFDVSDAAILPAKPQVRPDYAHVEWLKQRIAPGKAGEASIALAVGSGTINDLTKRAADELEMPYAVFATAASMDGYTASGASLVVDGVKQTVPCSAPIAVFADLDILAQAPSAMSASGYGDLLGKITAGADWLLADAVGIEPLIPNVWDLVQGPLRSLVSTPERVAAGDVEAIEQIFLGLVATGLAIQVAGTTRPASGSEHLFSHLWEMRGLEHNGGLVSHGFKVGLGTIVASALFERLIDTLDTDFVDIEAAVAAYPELEAVESAIRERHTHPMLIDWAIAECHAKHLSQDELRDRLRTLRSAWDTLGRRLRAQLMPPEQVADLLARAGCPVTPGEIGLDYKQLQQSYLDAQQIRRRYTVFDLAFELGLLEKLTADLFAPGGYWSAVAGPVTERNHQL